MENLFNLIDVILSKFSKRQILFLFSIIFILGMLLFSSSTSPLFPYTFGADSAIFMLIGKGLVAGKKLYIDLFDHKGSVLFLIEAFGIWVNSEYGIFFLQVIIGLVNLWLLFSLVKTVRVNKTYTVLDYFMILIAGYSYFFMTIQGGNLSEEWSLLFITISLFLFVKYAESVNEGKLDHPCLFAFIYGICFAIIAFIRINNAISVLAGSFMIIVFLIKNKRYKNLFKNLVMGILGIVLVLVLLFTYHSYHGNVYQMIYATFIFNFKYANLNIVKLNLYSILIRFTPLFISILCIVFAKKREYQFLDILLIFILFCNILMLCFVSVYEHYFAIAVPIYLLILGKYWNIKSVQSLFILFITAFYLMMIGYDLLRDTYYTYISDKTYDLFKVVSEDFSLIDEEDKDSVIGYNLPSSYYLMGDIIPCYKYYTLQDWWSTFDSNIMEDFISYISFEHPAWVIVMNNSSNAKLEEILNEEYILKKSNSEFTMYKYSK